MTPRYYPLTLLLIGALAGCTAPTGIPRALAEPCLSLPVPDSPRTNGELVDGFIQHREGHEVCRGILGIIIDQYGE